MRRRLTELGDESLADLATRVGDSVATAISTSDGATTSPSPADDDPVLERGTMIGRYVVLGPLGAGGMGLVYLAYDPELDRRIAIKLMRPASADTPTESQSMSQSMRSRLLREAQALAKLSHPNIVAVYDVGTVDESVFIAMEFVDGQTWRAFTQAAPRTWREQLAIAIAAGRGLAAAHDAGLVHRDFKPDNVQIDASGRTYVLDFGLASAEPGDAPNNDVSDSDCPPAAIDAPPPTLAREDTATTTTKRLAATTGFSMQLTEVGTVMGTPAYMPPEQQSGHADARSDQFAFCVALFEMLYGQRPYQARDGKSLRETIAAGDVISVDDRRAPVRVRKVLLRGLRPRAEDRFASMSALLAQLERCRSTRRQRTVAFVALGSALLTGAVATHSMSRRELEHCLEGASRFERVWNPAREAEIATAFDQLEVSFAAAAWTASRREIDRYRDEWQRSYADTCRATHESAAQSERLLDLRMACLDRGADKLDAVLQVAAKPDRKTAETIVRAVHELPEVSRCDDTRTLLADVAPPEDPKVRAEVEAIERELDELDALRFSERFQSIVARSETILERARKTQYPPTLSRAHTVVAEAKTSAADPSAASEHFHEAVFQAERVGAYELAAAAATRLLWTDCYLDRRFDLAPSYERHARALLEAAGSPPLLVAGLHHLLGVVTGTQRKLDLSADHTRKALEIRRQHMEATDPRLGMTLNNLALSSFRPTPERADESLRLLHEVVERARTVWTNGHPEIALATANIGRLSIGAGRYRDAVPYLEDAVEQWAALGQADDPVAREAAHLLSLAHLQLGHPSAALEVVAETERQYTTPDFSCHAHETTFAVPRLTDALTMLGRLDEARKIADRALVACGEVLGEGHTDLMHLYEIRGLIALAERDVDMAQRFLQTRLDAFAGGEETRIGDNHGIERSLAHVRLLNGETKQAIADLERLHAEAITYFGDAHPALAENRQLLGNGYAELGDPTRARQWYQQSLAVLEPAVGSTNPRLCEVLLDLAELEVGQGDRNAAYEWLDRAEQSFSDIDSDPRIRTRIDTLRGAIDALADTLTDDDSSTPRGGI